MKEIRFWTDVSKVLALVALAASMVLLCVPGASAANTLKILHSFNGTDGADPLSGDLIFDAAGNLYGTTQYGGIYGLGTVYEMTPNPDGSWTENVLYSFAGGSDGTNILSGVIFDASGNLYGTSLWGGTYGGGIVYKLSHNSDGSWSESILHTFTGSNDGFQAVGELTFDQAGNLYGTTTYGGLYGNGTVYKLSPNSDGSWTETTLYHFQGGTDASYPNLGRLVFDAAGTLYGITASGGSGTCVFWNSSRCGTVFQLSPQSDGTWTEKVLYRFTGGNDGGNPQGTPVFDKAGNIYGTTLIRGQFGNGTVFKLTRQANGTWKQKVIHQFQGGNDGALSYAGLAFDVSGNLYGTTYYGGGPCNCGTAFKLIPASNGTWTEQILRRLRGNPAGNPYGGVIVTGTGSIFGMTSGEHVGNSGAVFEIIP